MNPDPVRVLTCRFPGLFFWYGPSTRAWWALIPPPAGWRLVEARNPDELTRAVVEAWAWPWPSETGGASWRRD